MINVASLLAYQKPEASPVASYLSQGRRQAVAKQVHNAILYREGLPPRSRIEDTVGQAQMVFRRLNEVGVVLPQERPKNLDLPIPVPTIPGEKDTTEKLIPLFNMQDFLGPERAEV